MTFECMNMKSNNVYVLMLLAVASFHAQANEQVFSNGYNLDERPSALLSASDIQNILKRKYENSLYEVPLQKESSLTFDLNSHKAGQNKYYAGGGGLPNCDPSKGKCQIPLWP